MASSTFFCRASPSSGRSARSSRVASSSRFTWLSSGASFAHQGQRLGVDSRPAVLSPGLPGVLIPPQQPGERRQVRKSRLSRGWGALLSPSQCTEHPLDLVHRLGVRQNGLQLLGQVIHGILLSGVSLPLFLLEHLEQLLGLRRG